MALVSPYTASARVTEIAGVLEIRIPAPRSLFPMLFLPVWLVGWAFGLVSAIRDFGSGPGATQAFMAVWLTVWTAGGIGAMLTFLWMLCGQQLVRTGGPLSFEYGSRTVRFGLSLDEAEAKTLLPRFQEYLPTGSLP